MKYLIVFACLAVVVYSQVVVPRFLVAGFRDYLRRIGKICQKELGASDEEVDISLKRCEYPTTEKGKCFVACMHKKVGFLDASGKINKAHILRLMENLKPIHTQVYQIMKNASTVCTERVKDGDDVCDTAVKLYLCIENEKNAAGISEGDAF